VHFLEDDPADSIAYKALAVNLSDLAAKGAVPKYYLLGLGLPADIDDIWLASFSAGLRHLQDESGITLAGGDTTSSPGHLCISITAIGEVPTGKMLRRNGARAGDRVYVSGTLGDGAFGLKCLQGEIEVRDELVRRYRYPQARLALGSALLDVATASADISDGLLADLGHICKASHLGADLEEVKLPVSDDVSQLLKGRPDLAPLVYSGGDDYEIVFTAPEAADTQVQAAANKAGVQVTAIGRISDTTGIRLVDQSGELVQTARQGYQHFES
jgi:thiamine-monophosphate kinase